MSATNPYKAPSSDVQQTGSQETYQPTIFTTKGRIGRLRYLAYILISYVPIFVVGILSAISAGSFNSGSPIQAIALILVTLAYLFLFVFYFVIAKRRFNDMNKSGWMSLLMLIPIVNIVIGLWLVFGRGTIGTNRFGLAPSANPLSVKIIGFGLPIIFIIIIALVAVPAYQDFDERATNAAALYGE